MSTSADLDRRFTFHPPATPGRAEQHERLRRGGRALAELIADLVPEGPERTRAINAVDDAVMLANAGLARPSAGPLINTLTAGKLTFGPATGVQVSPTGACSMTSCPAA